MRVEELLDLGVGERLRRLREDCGLTAAELAQRSGVAEEQIDAIESSRAEPAVGELLRLAAPLGVSVGHFFQRAITARRIEVVRAAERASVPPPGGAARLLNYRYQSLSYQLSEKLMSPFLIEVPPARHEGPLPASSHEGEEFLFVLSGELEVSVGGEVHHLSPGDSIYFDSRVDHTLRALEGTTARLLACVASPQRGGDDALPRAYD